MKAQDKLYSGEDKYRAIVQENKYFLKKSDETENVKRLELDYTWLLEKHESIDMLMKHDYFDYEDIKGMYEDAQKEIDPLYLVKWRNLSYIDVSWEPLSSIKKYEKLLVDFERFNRSLDNGSRQKMVGFSYAHKQILKIFAKK